MLRRTLFPEIQPYEFGYLEVEDLHQIYWEQSGNPDGIPVIFMHGGPGAGALPIHRRFFDPEYYRIVIFDQRGSGRSVPIAELTNNTTAHLVNDVETLRELFGIKKWFVFGGSWGSSLALAYAESHPERCFGLVLRGIFLCRKEEISWFLTGMRRLFPEAWQEFVGHLREIERGDILKYYYRRLIDSDSSIHMAAANAWSRYESACSTLHPTAKGNLESFKPQAALALARIEAHYFLNNCFMDEGMLLTRIDRIADIPGVIVQGRYDVICPATSAVELANNWPRAKLRIINDAGHSAMEPGICDALITAMEQFKV